MKSMIADLRNEVRCLADDAFHKKLISGHGDGEYETEYQIVYKGKPRHLSLEECKTFLTTLLMMNHLTQSHTAWMQ